MKQLFTLFLLASMSLACFSQAIYEDERYVKDPDPLMNQKLKQWQGLKFGLLMHWGAYSQWGIVESWSLCPEEYEWCRRVTGSDPSNYFLYKQEYENLQLTFNPYKFDPTKWAKAAKNAGMKYMVFTTKHHDGFCMFDSKYTDYKITSKKTPFHTNPKSDVTKEIFNAFRDEGLWAGAYFSKPDWHVPSYWNPKYPPRDRNVNYDPATNPELWEEFVQFTHNQMKELLTNYGKVDILWLDGGWVSKKSEQQMQDWYSREAKASKDSYLKRRIINQDIRMDEFVEEARKLQPGLIVVDRAVHGKNQNYLTPENRVPDKTLPYPWESCIIVSGSWSFIYNPNYISGMEGVQMLVDIVVKGGNLLLNLAPSPTGEWDPEAYALLQEYADWMDVNGDAIYETKPLKPYKQGNICMTTDKKGNSIYYYMCKEGENKMPAEVKIEIAENAKAHKLAGRKVYLLGHKEALKTVKTSKGFSIKIPKKLQDNPPAKYVWAFRVEK